MVSNFLAGGCAGGTSLLVSYPFDVARTKLATDVGISSSTRKFVGTFDCLRLTYHSEGARGLYAGVGISLFGQILFKSLYLGGYDSTKLYFNIEHSPVSVRLLAAQV